MNQPIVPPATTSEAKCFWAAIRAALTIPARLYAVMPTIFLCLYTVLDAPNTKEALRTCKSYREPIHVLIADIVMPGLGGLELAKSVLELRPGLAVVLVSGYTDRALDSEAAGIGAKFLQKPFSLDALGRTVRFLTK